MDLFIQWYNHDMPHMLLEDGEMPAEVFERKMAPTRGKDHR